jgi:2-oxoglutarate ferredoxin oxidoreductase subunit gamma
MSDQVGIRLAGAGGQGLLLAGVILAEAAGIHDGKNVVQSQSYAPLARGAPSQSEVIISSEPVDYPLVEKADVLMALTLEAAERYVPDLKRAGTLIYDSTLIPHPPRAGSWGLPITETCTRATGKSFAASITGLGALAALTGVVSIEGLVKAVESRVPKGTEEVNLRALHAGYEAGLDLRKRREESRART